MFKKGDLVAVLRGGGFGSWSQSAKAGLVLKVLNDDEYEVYVVEGMGREIRPAGFVTEPSEELKARVMPRLREWLAKLETYEMQDWQPMYEVREALRIAVGT